MPGVRTGDTGWDGAFRGEPCGGIRACGALRCNGELSCTGTAGCPFATAGDPLAAGGGIRARDCESGGRCGRSGVIIELPVIDELEF